MPPGDQPFQAVPEREPALPAAVPGGDAPATKPEAMTILEVPGKTPEEIEAYWFKNVYQGDHVPQLTLRAMIMGAIIGVVMCLSNLYVGLQTGWGLGVAVTACIISYAVYNGLVKLAPAFFGPRMSILENNAMASAASSAGYSTGGTMVSATAAYLLVTGHHVAWPTLLLWTFFLSALGVFFAIPMKRQMVNIEQLKFPTGTAAAVTLRSLYASGAEAVTKAKALGLAALLGAVVAWFRDGMAELGSRWVLPSWTFYRSKALGQPLDLGFTIDSSLILVAAGGIMGMRVALSQLVGAVICWGMLVPMAIDRGEVTWSASGGFGYPQTVRWALWTGVAIMVSSSLLHFVLQGKTILRAFKGLGAVFGKKTRAEEDALARIEVPSSWFATGFGLLSIGTILTAHWGFGIPMHFAALAIALSFVLCIVACRATGETDTTPVGALGKITQLTYGVLIPQNMTANLMTASITGNTASSSADLLTDLKSGYLLGANPRKQFLAQFIGCFVGTAIIVPAFYLLVPHASDLGTGRFPAPSAQTWAGVAKLLSQGLHALPHSARWGMIVGGLVGVLLTVLEARLPARHKPWVLSPTGLGLAFVIPANNSISMFLGASVAWLLERSRPKVADDFVVPVSSGIIAGESIMGIGILMAFHVFG